jgi:2-oxoglutarate/2-oxoacid ferredoxin oxidoreductase subunit beta
VPLIEGAIKHGGAAFIDVISPCVALNNHAGITRSYDYVREQNEALNRIDLAPERQAVGDEAVIMVPRPDGSHMQLRRLNRSLA